MFTVQKLSVAHTADFNHTNYTQVTLLYHPSLSISKINADLPYLPFWGHVTGTRHIFLFGLTVSAMYARKTLRKKEEINRLCMIFKADSLFQ